MPHQLFIFRKTLFCFSLLALMAGGLSSCSTSQGSSEVVINENVAVPALLPRKQTVLKEEQSQITQTYNNAIAALKNNPDDLKQYLSLATVFITEGRITGNAGYYSNAALEMLNKVTGSRTANKDIMFEGLSLKSAVLLNMHQFKEALAVAEQGKALNDFNAGIYGALVDAHVEMGQYKEAVADCDKMLSIRPDLRSYSRASYLRQLHGDNQGAIDAMKMAVEAGVPGLEATEWARVTWGDLYFNTGKLDTARMIYESALTYRKAYPYAEMGLAHIAAARKNYDEAITHTRNAIIQLSEASFIAYLGDLYQLKGEQEKADDTHKEVLQLLEKGQREEAKSKLVKHNGNRELAQAYLNAGNYEQALVYARKDYEMRPDNMDANDLMAWVLYQKGDYAAAKRFSEKTLVTKAKNANQLYKAGLIYAAAGDPVKGAQLSKEAMSITPFIDPRILASAKK